MHDDNIKNSLLLISCANERLQLKSNVQARLTTIVENEPRTISMTKTSAKVTSWFVAIV